MVQGTFVMSVYAKKGEDAKRRVNYRQTAMRYLVVVIAVLVVFGCEYCFDNPSALQQFIEHNYSGGDQTKKLGEAQFNLLYSLYAFPNVIIPLLGGMLIDKIGARIVLVIAAAFCVGGQVIFGFGGLQNVFALMLAGRVVFGIGGEVLHAAQNTIISNWFKASELSLVLGICISFPKLGSSLNSILSPTLAKEFEKNSSQQYINVGGPIFVGLGFMIVSFLLAIVLGYIDRKSQQTQKIYHQSALLASQKQSSSVSKINLNKNEKKSVRIQQTSSIKQHLEQTVPEGGQHLNFKEIGKLPATFWLMILIAMLSQALFIPFLDNGNKYYVKVFKGIENPEEAGIYLVMPYCVSSLFVPIFGYFVDKVSKRSYVLIASCFFYTFTYMFMMFLEANVTLREVTIVRWVPCALLGVCIAIFCSIIVPTIPMLISPKLLGTGFGIMEMVQNLALGVFPLIAGALRETKPTELAGFHFQTLFFFLMSCICTGASIFLKAADLLTGDRLDVKDFRKQYLKKILKEDVEE